MKKRFRRRRVLRLFAFCFAAGLLLAVIRHAMSEVEVIKALFSN